MIDQLSNNNSNPLFPTDMMSLSDIVSSVVSSSEAGNSMPMAAGGAGMMGDSEKIALGDLDDLNMTLYDMGAKDLLLDVWESMDAEDTNSSSNNSSFNNSQQQQQQQQQSSHQQQLVLKDRLLTDSVLLHGEEFPVKAVKHEHSYSLSNGSSSNNNNNSSGSTGASSSGSAGSDGDSMPASPISLQDDMETECYPCIPMQSASNQRANRGIITTNSKNSLNNNMSALKRKLVLGGETVNIKPEPMSPTNVNVVDDDDRAVTIGRRAVTGAIPAGSSLLRQNMTTVMSNHLPQTTAVHFARPKHPQSLLKQKPMTTHTILVTTPGPVSNTNNAISNSHISSSTTVVKTEPGLPSQTSFQPSFCSQQMVSAVTTAVTSSPSVLLSQQQMLNRGAPIQTSLISSQPADSNGVLVLTDEEKKTLISEGYPIPTRLPLSKAEEKSLKKIRRKIKNKISAQESRRKKKEFVDTLERQVEVASQELGEYKRKCQVLEKEKATLLTQLKSLRAMVGNNNVKKEEEQEVDVKMEPAESPTASLCDGLGLD